MNKLVEGLLDRVPIGHSFSTCAVSALKVLVDVGKIRVNKIEDSQL